MPYTYEATYVLRDRGGNVGTCRLFFPFNNGDFTTAYARAATMLGHIRALSTAEVTSYTVRANYEIPNSGVPGGGDITSVFVVVIRSVNDFHSVILIPAVSNFYMLRDNDNLPLYVADLSNGELNTLANALVNSIAVDRWGFDIDGVVEMGWSQ